MVNKDYICTEGDEQLRCKTFNDLHRKITGSTNDNYRVIPLYYVSRRYKLSSYEPSALRTFLITYNEDYANNTIGYYSYHNFVNNVDIFLRKEKILNDTKYTLCFVNRYDGPKFRERLVK